MKSQLDYLSRISLAADKILAHEKGSHVIVAPQKALSNTCLGQ